MTKSGQLLILLFLVESYFHGVTMCLCNVCNWSQSCHVHMCGTELIIYEKEHFDVYLYLHPLMAILKPRQDHVFYHHSFKFSFMSFILIWNKMIWLITHWITDSLTHMLAEMLTAFPELVWTCLFRSGQVRSRQVR